MVSFAVQMPQLALGDLILELVAQMGLENATLTIISDNESDLGSEWVFFAENADYYKFVHEWAWS